MQQWLKHTFIRNWNVRLRLSGPLADDPRARILHLLLLAILAWFGFHLLFIQPFFVLNKPVALGLYAALAADALLSLHFLRRGSLRNASVAYVCGIWLISSIAIFLSGGIRSPLLLLYMALPVSAAWLIGYRATVLIAACCVASAFALAILEAVGVGPYRALPGTPFGLFSAVLGTTVAAVVPVIQILRNLQKALDESDVSLRLAVETTGVGMFDYYPQTQKLIWSDVTRSHFGMVPQKEIDHEMFLAAVHPEDRERVRQTGLAMGRPGNGGQLAIEYRAVGDDGRERWLAVRGRMLFDSGNRPIRMIGTVLDIGERKRLEEQLRRQAEELEKVMEVAPVAVLVSRELDCHQITGNRAANLLCELDEPANLSSSPDGDKLPGWRFVRDGVPIPPQELPIQIACTTGKEVRDWEAEMIMSSGARKFIWGGASPLRDAAGQVRGAVGAFEDITAIRLRADAALRESQERFRIRTLFMANMSHELRTPLNSILGFSGILRRDKSMSAKQAEALDIISRSGAQLLALIDDILDMIRIETGHERLEIATADAVELVREVMSMMHALARQKKLALSSAWSGETVRLIRVDGPKLRRILVNLLENAIKYTDAGSVTLRLNTVFGEGGKPRLKIEVQDTGIGIAPEEQPHIFEAFVQLSRPNARKGSGLGLAICREALRIMGGTIRVESSLGKGSTFYVELPVEIANESVAEDTRSATSSDREQWRILLIEPDSSNRLLFTRLLQGAGFRLRSAEDAETGMAIFREWEPHFIWLDIRLQTAAGIEVATRIRALQGGRSVKIAALSANRFADKHAGVSAGVIDDFIRRPWGANAILECMERLLGVRHFRFDPAAKPVAVSAASDLSGVAGLHEGLKSQLLKAVLLLDKQRIIEAIHSVSAIDPALAAELTTHAEALEFTLIMRAVLPKGPS